MKIIIKFLRCVLGYFGIIIIKDRPANSPEKQLSAVLNFLKINIIFDIGANEGQFVKSIRPNYQGKVISFEPLTLARNKLLINAQKDNNWIVHKQCAIGSHDGQVKINISKNSVSSSILPMTKVHSSAAKESIYVGSETIDVNKLDSIAIDYINDETKLFIKIDAQGYEKEILDGSKKILDKADGILCELSLVQLYEGQYLWRDIVNILDKQGFTLWALQKGFTNPDTGQTLQMDGIFVRNERLEL